MTVDITNYSGGFMRDLRRDLRTAHTRAGRVGVAVATANCPVSDGDFKPEGQPHLVETIEADTRRTSDGYDTEVRAGDPDRGVDYPDFVENGTGVHRIGGGGRQTPWVYTPNGTQFFITSGNEAQPFMSPAFEAAKPVFVDSCRKAVRG